MLLESSSESISAVIEGHSSVLGGMSESVAVGRELTDVGGVSWL